MTICKARPGDWNVKVDFKSKSVLQANASGVLPVPPKDALAMVTDEAGDSLFRVVQRTALPPLAEGTQIVEVVNKAAVRILCWKLWTTNRVVYEISTASGARDATGTSSSGTTSAGCRSCTGICCCSSNNPPSKVSFQLESSNVLNSLSGTWSFEPINIPRSSLKQASRSSHCYASTASKHQLQSLQRNLPLRPAASAREQQQLQQGLNMLAIDSTIADSLLLSHKDSLGSATTDDAEEIITGTLVRYEQLAQPKGLPPGMRFVPGLSDAVRASIGREVRQMLDKITYVADLEVCLGLTPQQALTLMTQQLEQAGGSFKQLTKQRLNLEGLTSPLIHDISSAPTAAAVGSKLSSGGMTSNSGVYQRRMSGTHSVVGAGVGQLVPQMNVQPLGLPVAEASA